MQTSLGIAIGGVARVYCVHDKQKRSVVDLEFDPRFEKVHLCPCCENLFTKKDDEPGFCSPCGGHTIHDLGGPLPDPHKFGGPVA